MEQLQDNLIQRTSYPDIDEVDPLSKKDQECMEELRNVLKKHGKLGRFGISLLHDHFPIADDELLVEVCNAEERTLTTKPIKMPALEGQTLIETHWELGNGNTIQVCRQACLGSAKGHVPSHENLPDV